MTETSGSAPETPQGQPSQGQQPPPYGQPPAGAPGYGQVPPQGQQYGQPPASWAPQPMSPSDERLWALLSHLSFFVLAIIAPIVIMLTKGKESAFVRHHAVEALNFHITFAIAILVSVVLIFVIIGIFTMIAAYIVGIILAIMASVASNKGEWYKYPINIRFVK
jgi:uncharacterized protein